MIILVKKISSTVKDIKMKNKKLNFAGQRIYVGIDVHKNSWDITIILNAMKVKKYSMNPSPQELYNYLRKHYPNGEYHTVYEAGFSGFWADRELQALGINNIIVNPADVPTKSKERRKKTDRIDSGKLARELSVGHLEGIYIPNEEEESLRTLVRLRRQFVTDQTRQKKQNKIITFVFGRKAERRCRRKTLVKKIYYCVAAVTNKAFGSKASLRTIIR